MGKNTHQSSIVLRQFLRVGRCIRMACAMAFLEDTMFTIYLTTSFKASHQLTFSNGTTEPRHDHDWKVCAAVSAAALNSDGLVMDFEELKHLLKNVLQDFDGQRLETSPLFRQQNTSAENVARMLYQQIDPKLPRRVHLDYVEVTEAAGCRARFSA